MTMEPAHEEWTALERHARAMALETVGWLCIGVAIGVLIILASSL